ncbi:ADP-ribosylation factor-binding protein GGA1 isoform X2 [Prorops nasuta]|uniref:ADP-ribosylation factor-binding protein GGA1 isoform X2 n=1 Tax=Prorops nasuta TaxID=863751 RepID=UPI0034CEEF9C
MDVVTTSLEALIQRATNSQNQKPDTAAIEAFCVMITKESEGIQIGSKLLATYIQSSTESEALQALFLLDICMKKCGPSFHAEIGKFRFLNEMVRLVSPKYFGNKTPQAVRQKVLQLLYNWTKEYPREVKIKEAYDMLKKQGVIEEDLSSVLDSAEDILKNSSKIKNTLFEDEEKSKLLQKLLHSKNPADLHAANRLIKTMVKEDERRVQINSRRIKELESVHNNAKLLSEMLDSYDKNEARTEDLELMKELYQSCERLKSIILRLANETQDNEELLAASDELGQAMDKYTSIIILGKSVNDFKTNSNIMPSLLDLSSPSEISSSESTFSLNAEKASNKLPKALQSDLEALGDIFSTLEKSKEFTTDANLLLPNTSIMQPVISILPAIKKSEEINNVTKLDNKAKALEELNELGETLLKQSLSNSVTRKRLENFSKLPLKDIAPKSQSVLETVNLNLNSSSTGILAQPNTINKLEFQSNESEKLNSTFGELSNGDDTLLDITMEVDNNQAVKDTEKKWRDEKNTDLTSYENTNIPSKANTIKELEIKPLTDINISLQDIQPGSIPPMTVIDEKNDISVVLHFAKDSPRPDVYVVVITTMSKSAKPLSNYLFQAVVPKRCKCRLQPPSGTNLPAHNPFLPPSAITQIMLIANPHKENISLKFMLSYIMDDETFTEMGEVDKIPYI